MNRNDSYAGIRILGCGTFMFTLLAIVGIITMPNRPSEQEEQDERKARYTAVVEDIAYLYDDRTGLCFAYLWGGGYRGGPALATVPYEAVKDHLINPPKNPPKEIKNGNE